MFHWPPSPIGLIVQERHRPVVGVPIPVAMIGFEEVVGLRSSLVPEEGVVLRELEVGRCQLLHRPGPQQVQSGEHASSARSSSGW